MKNIHRFCILFALLVSSLSSAWGQTYNISTLNGQTITDPNGYFYDSGGSTGNYLDDENLTVIFQVSPGKSLVIEFEAFNLENGYDFLNQDGTPYSGTSKPSRLTLSGGQSVTYHFTSDYSQVEAGWRAKVETINNTKTYTVPTGITKIKVECWGAGGAGGGSVANNNGGGGGGGGAYSSSIIDVTAGNTYLYTEGFGGIGGVGADGEDGGDSWFDSPTTVLAKGGLGGLRNRSFGVGGLASSSIGLIKYNGGNGARGIINNRGNGGNGGSSAGINANGNTGVAPTGGGDGGNGGNRSNGANGNVPGGAGGGAGVNNGNIYSGGNGANGQVIITLPAKVNLSSPNQITASNVYQQTANHTLYSFQTAVTTSDATLKSLSFTTSGSYIASDVANFKLLYSETNDILTASQIGATITAALGAGAHTFVGLNQDTNTGSTGYFWITTDIDLNATIGANIAVDAITLSDSDYEFATVSGSATTAGLQTILGMPRIALSSANPAVPAATLIQGSSNNVIYRFVNIISVSNTTLNTVSFTTTGTGTNFDITRFRLWHSTTDNFSTATQIGSDIISGTGDGPHSFSSLLLNQSAGSSNYFWITANIASFPIDNRTVGVSAITTNDLSYSVGLKSGSAFAGGTQTISVMNGIFLDSSFPAVSATSVPQETTKKDIYKFSTIISGSNRAINSVNFTTSGTYIASDVVNFKLWYNTVNSLVTATQLGASLTTSIGTGIHTFSGFNQTINAGKTGYFWITADFSATATPGNTLKVEAITTANLNFTSGTKYGSAYYGGIQTIEKIVDTDGDGVADLYDYDDDNDGIPDLKENLPCNITVEELFPNSDFEAGNTGFSSGYGFVNNTYRALWPEGRYAIVDNANIVHDNFANCSAGHGNMMVVNGSVNADLIVWSSGSIAVTPYTDYTLRVQIASVHPSNPAQLIFNVNGDNIGSQFNATTTNCQWTNAEAIWNSGSSNRATFEVVNLNLVGGGNDFAIDNISCTYRTTCDSDGDLLPDQLDLDSDNDGIYDIIEAGGRLVHAGNGTISGFVDADGDGLSDNVDNIDSGKGAGEVQFAIPLANADTDGDGLANTVDIDSDGDLCLDVTEAGYNDGDDDGLLGISPVAVNDKGVVTGQGGYTLPADADGNGTFDFMQQVPIINTQPVSSSICLSATSSASFTVGASNTGGTYQWQVSTNNGATWNDITGATSATLTLNGITATADLNRYRVQLFHPAYVCSPLSSDEATLRAFASVPAQPGVITGDNPVCSNISGLPYSVALVNQAVSYNWTLPASWVLESGAGANTIVASSGNNGGNIQVSATNTCGTSAVRSLAVTVSSPVPTITAPAFTSVCQSADVRYETQSGKSNYIWNITTGSEGSDYAIVSGGSTTDNYIVIKWMSTGNKTVTVNYTSGGCQGAIAGSKSLNVIANAIVMNQPVSPAAMCAGTGSATISITTFGSVTALQWQVSTNGGANWNNISNAAPYSNVTTNTMTITNPAVGLNNAQYRCMVIGACGDIYSNAATLTVNSTDISSQSTDGQTQFVGGSFTPISVTAVGTGLSYQWYSNTTASIIGGTSLGVGNGAQSDVYTPQTAVAGTLYYYCEVSGACGSKTSNISGAFVVLPKVDITGDISPCGLNSYSYSATAVVGCTYVWSILKCTFDLPTTTTSNPVSVTWDNPETPITNIVTVQVVVTHTASSISTTVTKNVTVTRTPETGPQYHVTNIFSN